MAIITENLNMKMIYNIILILSFSLIVFVNVYNNSYAQGNGTTDEGMLSVQINGTGSVSPLETETKYEGFSEPQTPSTEQLKAFEEEIKEEEEYIHKNFKENQKVQQDWQKKNSMYLLQQMY